MNDARISRDAVSAVFSTTHSLPAVHSHGDGIMGGSGTITIVGGSDAVLGDLWSFARTCEQRWSRFVRSSDISRLNWAEGQPVEVHPDTVRLVRAMREGYDLTYGSFDPTLLPDVLAAGYRASQLDPSAITELPVTARAPGRLSDLVIDDNVLTLPVGTTLDAGGIGKGFTADLVAEKALEWGAVGVMAEFGGDIAVAGSAPDGVAWHLGLENPFVPDTHLQVVNLCAGGIVTSSQLKRRFGDGENQTHHLVDPQTHQSAQSSALTVTVLATSAARAEVLTKRGFVQDPTEYLSWLPTVGAAGFIVMADQSTAESANWGDYR